MSAMLNNGVSINYRRVGQGEDVVLIHGLAANHAFWHVGVLLPLARRYRVTVYDLRGHGYSGMPSNGYTPVDMAGDLDVLLGHLDIAGAHLIGHSFGGIVALQFALLHGQRVKSLTIVDSRIRALQPTNRPRDLPNWPEAKKRLARIGLIIPEDETDMGLWLLDQLATPQWRERRQELEGSPLFIPFSRLGGGNSSADRWLELVDTTTAKKEVTSSAGLTIEGLAGIQQPTLAMYGERSSTMPSFRGLGKHMPNFRRVMVPGAGHFFPVTQPEFFVRTVSQFLDECGR